MTTAAAKATAAADALLAWLRDQPPVCSPARRGPPDAVPPPRSMGAADGSPAAAGSPAEPAGADWVAADPSGAAPDRPAPTEDGSAPAPRQAPTQGTGVGESGGTPLRPAHTDWLHHRLSITGPPAAVAAFRAAAAGAGIIPWQLDLDRVAEDCCHLLAAPPPPQQRSLSLAGARIVAGQLRDAVARRHDLAVARVGHSRACPFDLHALVPVPEQILRCGPDDPMALAWLWQHWGTTRELRHVTAAFAASEDRRRRPKAGAGDVQITFWSADWSPWRALAALEGRFPALRFDLRPTYHMP